MDTLTLRIGEFEGPMDLLLHLIKEMKIDIYNIPMVELTHQYLSYIHSMQEMELEVASEYLLMAATLLEIKARMLLPKPKVEIDEVEVEEDPRDELVEKLMEYKQFQEGAKKLEELSFQRGMHYGKEASDLSALQEIIPLQEGQVTTQDLWNALKKIARRNLDKMPLQANIQHETHTVEEMMDSILTKIQENPQKSIRFDKCFPSFHRHAIVTTFLAMLQLVREHKIRLVQHVPYEDIVLETCDKGGAFSG